VRNPANQSPDQPTETRPQTGHTLRVLRPFRNCSLRTKLIVAFLIVMLIPLSLLAFLSSRGTRAALIDATNQALLAGASQTAAKLDAFINTNLNAVSAATLFPGIVEYLRLPPDQRAGSDKERLVSETLQGLEEKDENILSYALLDAEGQNVMDTVTINIGQDESDRDYFHTPARTNQPYVTPIEFDLATGEAALYFSSPVHSSGQEILGVLRIRYDATILQQLIVQSNGLAGERSFAVLLDENHLRLAHGTVPDLVFKLVVPLDQARLSELHAARRLPVEPAAELATDISAFETGLARMDAAEPYFTTQLVATGERLHSVAVKKMETRPWLVVFAQPQEVFLAPIEGHTRTTLLVLAMVIAGLVVAAALVMTQWLSGPITRLTAVAAKIAEGDLTAQAEAESRDEIGLLATTFNSMTTQLRQTMEGLEQRVADLKRAEANIRQRTAQMEALRQVELKLTAQLNLDTLLHSIVSRAMELLGGTAGGLALYRPERDVLEAIAGTGDATVPIGSTFRRGEGLSGRIWETGEPQVVDDYQHWDGRAATYERPSITAVVGVPVRWGSTGTGEEFLGTLIVQADAPRTFSPADVDLLSLFATQAAIAIRNVRLYEEAQSTSEQLAIVNRIARAASATMDLDDLLEIVYQEISAIFQADAFLVALYDEETDELNFRLQIDEGEREPLRLRPLGIGLTSFVVTEKRPLLIQDFEQERDHLPPPVLCGTMKAPASWLGVPMQVGERVVGVICVQAYRPHAYGEEEQLLLSTIADQVAIALENARLFQAEREQRELSEGLEHAAAAVSSTLHLDRVLDHILEQVERVVAGDAFNIMLIEDEHAQVVRWRGYEPFAAEKLVSTVTFRIAEVPGLQQMVETGEPIVIRDTMTYPSWVGTPGMEWLHSYVAAPIQVGGVTVGFLNVDGTRPGQFGPADARRLEAFASHAATAIENARLFGAVQQRVAEMETLQRTSLQLTSSLDLSAVLDSIATSTLTLVGANDCHIYLYDEEADTFAFGTALWKDGRHEAAVQAPRPDGITATVARGRHPVVINDAPSHPLYTTPEAQEWSVQAIAGFPLKRAGRVLGVFTIAFLRPHTFSQEELRVLGLLADQAAIAIENAQLYRRLRDHAKQLEQRVQERTAQLHTQYARLEAILHSASDGIVVTDAEGQIIQTNPVSHTWLAQTLSPEDAVRLREEVQNLARQVAAASAPGERPKTVLELTGLDLELTAAPISQPGTEEVLRPDFGEIGRATQRRPAAVVAVHDVSHLKALDRVKSRFVSNVSHELRTPVTTIKLYAALMRRNPEKWEEYLAPLAQEADRQAQLVADILQISRIDTGRLELKPCPTPLNQLTKEIITSHQVLAQDQGLTLEHRLMDTPRAEPGTLASLEGERPGTYSVEQPAALVDPERMRQVLNNLVRNAICYTPEGGTVTLSTGKKEAEGRVWAVATVRDTGMGIPEEELPHIFERFFRGEKPQLMQISGTGLGLAIARDIVELHGGHMTVESEVDVGTTFTVWLPLANDFLEC
jgi:signal transduction histidine kinase/HAMP domain-containing protein